MTLVRATLAALATAAVAVLSGCAAGAPPDSTSSSAAATPSGSQASAGAASSPAGSPAAQPSVAAATGPVTTTKVGVSVTGKLGDKPALTVPSGAAPGTLTTEVLQQGDGAVITKGDTIVVNYLGQTWVPKDGKPNIFDNSYDRRTPAAFGIGIGKVIPGWDKGLVGQKVGSRMLLAIPAADAYGTATSAGNELGGQALVFVVDLVSSFNPGTASATGTPVTPTGSGLPQVKSESGKQPTITSVSGVTAGQQPISALILRGTGPAIDSAKTLLVQVVSTDVATGKQTQATWGQALQSVPAANVLQLVTALKEAPVGSRAVAVTPTSAQAPASVLVVDVVAQF